MRLDKLLTTALLPASLVLSASPNNIVVPQLELQLVELLEKHNLALVPRSDLTDALKELNVLLKSESLRPPILYKRQNAWNDTSSGSQSSGSQSSGSQRSESSNILSIPGLDDLGDLTSSLTGLTSLLTETKDFFSAIKELLSAEFLQAFHDAMVYLAATLKPPAPDQIRSILGQVGPLLDLVGELDLKSLVNEIKGVDIAGIVNKVLKLLTDDNLNNIDTLLTNGAGLLTSDFVNTTKTLIQDVGPLLGDISPLLKELTQLDLAGLLDAVKPLLTQDTINDIIGLVKNGGNLLTPEFVNSTKTLIEEVGPLLGDISPLLKELTQLDLQGLLDAIKPLLTTDSVNAIVGLVKNAGDLLTPNFVNSTKTLIEDVGPLLGDISPLLKELTSLDLRIVENIVDNRQQYMRRLADSARKFALITTQVCLH